MKSKEPSKNIHVLFLCSWFPNRHKPTDGNFVQKHAEASALYNTVSTISVFPDPDIQSAELVIERENNCLNVVAYYKKVNFSFPVFSSLLKAIRYFQVFKKAYSEVLKQHGKPAIVHLNIVFPIGIMALYLKHFKGIPFVATENSTGYHEGLNKMPYWKMRYCTRILKHAKINLPVSKNLELAYQRLGIPAPFQIISNVANEHIFTVRKAHPIVIKQLLHISTCNDEHKNISGMLRVINRLSKTRADFQLRIISDGNTLPFHEKCREWGLLNSTVFFENTKTTEEIAQFMHQSIALVLFSNYENFPCVISESLMTGMPVVSSNVNGIPEHVNASNGILVEPKDEEALLEALNAILDRYETFQPEKLHEYAFKKFSYQSVGQQFTDVYLTVLNS